MSTKLSSNSLMAKVNTFQRCSEVKLLQPSGKCADEGSSLIELIPNNFIAAVQMCASTTSKKNSSQAVTAFSGFLRTSLLLIRLRK